MTKVNQELEKLSCYIMKQTPNILFSRIACCIILITLFVAKSTHLSSQKDDYAIIFNQIEEIKIHDTTSEVAPFCDSLLTSNKLKTHQKVIILLQRSLVSTTSIEKDSFYHLAQVMMQPALAEHHGVLSYLQYVDYKRNPNDTTILQLDSVLIEIEQLEVTKHPVYQIVLMELINYNYEKNRFGKLYEYAQKLNNDISVESPSLLEAYRISEAALYLGRGGYTQEALALHERTIMAIETLESSVPKSTILSNLGSFYLGINDFKQAEHYLDRALDYYKINNLKRTKGYSSTLSIAGRLYWYMGLHERARDTYIEVLDIYEEVFSVDHPFYITALGNLGGVYRSLKENSKALEMLLRSMDQMKKIFEPNDFNIGAGLISIGDLYHNQKDYNQAIASYAESKDIFAEVLGPEHTNVGIVLTRMGSSYQDNGQLELAEKSFDESLRIMNLSSGQQDYYITSAKEYFLKCLAQQGKTAKYNSIAYSLFDTKKIRTDLQFSFRSEDEKEIYISKHIDRYVDVMMKNGHLYPAINNNELLYDIALFSKGLKLSSDIQIQHFIEESIDTLVTNSFERLKEVKADLSIAYKNISTSQEQLQELVKEKRTIEKYISNASIDYKRLLIKQEIEAQDIQKNLRAGEMSIEFVNYYDKETKLVHYVALTCSKERFDLVYLCGEEELVQALRVQPQKVYSIASEPIAQRGLKPKSQTQNTESLYKLLIDPLEHSLTGINTIYFSPVGLINKVNFGALSEIDDVSLFERFDLHQVFSTKIVVDSKQKKPLETVQIIAGVDYGSKHMGEQKTASSGWNFLPWTAQEGANIHEIFTSNKKMVDYISGKNASEQSFKKLTKDSDQPDILNIATHGFFLDDEGDKALIESLQIDTRNPLSKSGLILANANYAWQGNEVDAWQDGILSAEEIAEMNLSGISLVVLSACETALGDIKGVEGVYGLQRAFKKAGVDNMIMSLWPVPDKETSKFMTQFYTYLIDENLTINNAFSQTQRYMKYEYPNPLNWAGFVLIE